MTSNRARFAALALAALVAACGSGAGTNGTPRPTGAQYRTLPELIEALGDVGCDLAEVDPVEGFEINRQAECSNGSVVVYTFGSSVSQREVVAQIRELEGRYAVEGDLWAAETSSRRLADRVKAGAGGTILSGQ
jgi:hypothetical protein